MNKDEEYMKRALKLAEKAYKIGEVPVGVIIVQGNKVISSAYNKKNKTNLVTNHAEIIAINKASKKNKNWRLNECVMYVTLEPCSMCMCVIRQARIKKVIYGAKNEESVERKIIDGIKPYFDIEILDSVMEKESSELLKKFFKNRR